MSKPTTNVITKHLKHHGAPVNHINTWARYLTGLEWAIIKPLVDMAVNAKVHPALAAGMVIRSSQDEDIKATLTGHLESKQDTPK